jgi:CarD family transcriptional regulator
VKPNVEQGRGSFRAQAVSQKTRKKSTSAKASHKDAKKVAAASRSASKGRTATKAPAAKSSKNKRSAMPNKTAKPAAKATVAKPVAAKPAAKPAVAKAPAAKPAAKAPVAAAPAKAPVAAAKPAVKPAAVAPKVEEKKVVTQRQGFKANEFVVYPAHGVGQILAIEEQEIAGAKLELFVINFIKDKMTLRVPTAKVANVGMRKLSDPALVKRALETLKGRARVKRTMWSRRAQEYEAKINSGDIVAIAEVVRERQLYEAALDRLSREIAVVQHSTETEAVKEIEAQLAKSPRRTGAKSEAAEGEADADAEGDSDETEGGATVADEAA